VDRGGEQFRQLEINGLSPEVIDALQAAIGGQPVVLLSEGQPVGVLEVRTLGLASSAAATAHTSAGPHGEGVVVVATAMPLSEAARRRLSDELGDHYLVIDMAKAPSSADVLLIPPVSPQLIAHLRGQFPNARLVITEIEDEELGIMYAGPVSRLLNAGASAYLPSRPIAQIATGLHAHLTRAAQFALESEPGAGREHEALPAPSTDHD